MHIKLLLTILGLAAVSADIAGQNVGIGTNSPTRAKLELNGMVGNTTAIFGSGGNGIGLIASWPYIGYNAYFNGGFRYIANGHASMQYFVANTGDWGFESYASGAKDALVTGAKLTLSIYANGRIAIGPSPDYNSQLSVGRDAGKDASAFFAAPQWSAFHYGASEHTYIRGGTDQGKLYLNYYPINSKIAIGGGTSMVGINSAVPVYPLEMQHPDFGLGLMRMGSLNHWLITVSLSYLKLFFRSTTANNSLTQLGVFDYTTGHYSSSSDRRMKKQIEPLPPMLEKLTQLQPYRYQMRCHNPGRDETFGLIAQDVKLVFPELVHVTKNANTGYQGITDVHTLNYSGLAPLVIKALQEQQAQLALLEERTAALEKK